jgi:hypothetical protein
MAQSVPDNPIQIGNIALAKGVVTARSSLRPLSALAKGSSVYLGDIIETASRSFAVIRFNDGGKVTLRPESRFDLNEYDETVGQQKESFELIKGGLRAVTGAIGKATPENVKYTARNTTIGIRGTIFVVKLCELGVDGCKFSSGINDQTAIANTESSKKYTDIFVTDKKTGVKKRITREELEDILSGVYVSVHEGAIRLSTKDWYIDMEAGDKCLIDYSGEGTGQREGQEEVECFIKGRGLEDIDVYLSGAVEEITTFNLFDDSEIYVGNEICEIN